MRRPRWSSASSTELRMSLPMTAVGPLKVLTKPIFTLLCWAGAGAAASTASAVVASRMRLICRHSPLNDDADGDLRGSGLCTPHTDYDMHYSAHSGERSSASGIPFTDPRCGHLAHRIRVKQAWAAASKASKCQANPFVLLLACKIVHPALPQRLAGFEAVAKSRNS